MSWLVRLINRLGGVRVADDPDQLVEVATVPSFEGPVLVEVLRRSGLNVAHHETFDHLGTTSAVLRVPRADHRAASEVIRRYRAG